jgi:PKD repeat protein
VKVRHVLTGERNASKMMGETRAMRVTPLLAAAGVLSMALSGCTGRYESDFPVLVVNRNANSIEALVNGSAIGQVSAGETGSFTLTLPESNANVFNNGAAPTPQAQVTFSARDARTGSLSLEKRVTLTQSSPTSVVFTTEDFPASGPTIARFTFSPTNPTINLDVSFNASSSTAINGTYAWDFGDGNSGSGVTATHRYLRGGTFTITLTVTSDNRQVSTASRTINISTTLPAAVANFAFSPANPALNQDISFTASGTIVPGPGGGPGGGPGVNPIQGATYAWDFGDGTVGNGQTATHRYTRGGTFTVRLTVTSTAGLAATTTRQITVTATLPAGSANFVFSPTDARVGDLVYFNASSSTITNATSYVWDFGDGTTGTGVTPTHRYPTERTYTVSLTVTNDRGQTASASKVVTVIDLDTN